MSKHAKRTRILADKTAATSITIRDYSYQKNGHFYNSFLVQGWKENGRWARKEFKKRADAENFAALKRIEIENQGRGQRLVLCPLDDDGIKLAVDAFDALGDAYTLPEAISFFLKHHRAPDFTIRLADGIKQYLDACERQGVRPRTILQFKSVLSQFCRHADNPHVHQITEQSVEAYLRSLGTKDGASVASRKTWNNYRNDLNRFFVWACDRDAGTQRPWTFLNPVLEVSRFSSKQVAEQSPEVATTAPEEVLRLFSGLMQHGGALVKYFALAYFAGIRPDGELKAIADQENKLINLRSGFITIPAGIAKTKDARKVSIPENLAAWLQAFSGYPIIPKNFDRLIKEVRKQFSLQHDETRHSFISYHVAIHRSVGDAALQAGNSEGVVKKHYLNLHPKEDGAQFFSIVPDMEKGVAVFSAALPQDAAAGHLKAI
ncbi:MAG: phage integrase N-terminal SAM-like domain-containing protein [Verrucomicrobia bacterium]|nr:phage integrase N-terminal SAM-like domain-containing protein [Verrucomicrobiota bacterium]